MFQDFWNECLNICILRYVESWNLGAQLPNVSGQGLFSISIVNGLSGWLEKQSCQYKVHIWTLDFSSAKVMTIEAHVDAVNDREPVKHGL